MKKELEEGAKRSIPGEGKKGNILKERSGKK
jgi:hypothetical protein